MRIFNMELKYEYGLHCGDKNCPACGTQRFHCDELDRLDTIEDRKEEDLTPLSQFVKSFGVEKIVLCSSSSDTNTTNNAALSLIQFDE